MALQRNDSDEESIPPQYRKAPKPSWLGSIWDVADAPADERRVLWKLDAVLLTFMSLGYFLKNLDQTNVNSAFVSGMKEDLGMYGNELTTAITCWTVGYVVGQIPSNLLLTRISPRWWIPFLELGWGICTLASYKVQSPAGLYTVRFFVGLFESGFYPAAQYILGSFYKPSELGKRAVLFHTAGGIGGMISSVLQAAAYTNLSGVHGLAGWRWLFIIDAVITLPIALLGLVFLPALPGQRDWKPSFWLKAQDLEVIERRLASINRKPPAPFTVSRVKGYLAGWHIWVLPILYILWNNSLNATSIMPLWLKSFNTVDTGTGIHYTVAQINHYIMPITGIYVLTAWFFAWTSDGLLRGRRWPPILFTTILNAAIVIALANLPLYEHLTAHWVLYYLTMVGGGMSGLFFSWANEICSVDNEERSLVVALMNDMAYVLQAIVPNFTWKQTDYPKSTIGLYYSAGLSIALFFWTLLTHYLHQKDIRKAKALYAISDISSTDDSIAKDAEQVAQRAEHL